MSGQLKAAAFVQKKNRQPSMQMGATMFSGDQENWNQQPLATLFLLNDPVLDAIKRHLTIGPRLGFEPISQRFARVAFFFQRRMGIKLIGYQYNRELPEKSVVQLAVKSKNGGYEFLFDIAFSNVEGALHALFLHIRKWRFVDFAHNYHWYTGHDGMNDQVVSHLLSAILEESCPVIDIRRFCCPLRSKQDYEKAAELLQRGAPFFRYLSIGLRAYDMLLPALEQSIGACRELRRLVIKCPASEKQFLSSSLPMVLGLEKLDGLLIGNLYRWEVARHCLSIDEYWLRFFAQPAFFPLLNKMQRLNVAALFTDDSSRAAQFMQKILTEMRSPARVDIRVMGIEWPSVWNDFLPLIYSTRANILIRVPNQELGILELTADEFAAGLSTLPAVLQSSLIPPQLENATVKYDHYVNLEFRFPNGGKLTIKREWCED